MLIKTEINTNLKIEKLEDLSKLKSFVEGSNLKLNHSQIARELGVDARTVKKYINGYVKINKRKRVSKIDEYNKIIEELLSDESKQIFYYKRVLWQYLTDNHGLECAESSFRRYISKKEEFNIYFKKRKKIISKDKAPMRFETAIGQQAQIDWKENILFELVDGNIINVNIFALVLSYSRFKVYRVSLNKSQDILFSFLSDSFEKIGGVPKEIITDNMKTVMDIARTNNSEGKVNNKFQQFAKDFGFEVKPCIAGRPNTKAKVEAPMKLLDEIRAYNGKLDYEELVKLVEKINNRANSKCHQSTGKIPILHLEKEKDFLSPLPTEKIRNQYTINTTDVIVNPQSMICYKSNYYSVPPKYIGKRLKLQVYDEKLHIYYSTDLITIHPINNNKLNYHEKHYIEVTSLTFNKSIEDIEMIAKDNLKLIGEVYKNDNNLQTINK